MANTHRCLCGLVSVSLSVGACYSSSHFLCRPPSRMQYRFDMRASGSDAKFRRWPWKPTQFGVASAGAARLQQWRRGIVAVPVGLGPVPSASACDDTQWCSVPEGLGIEEVLLDLLSLFAKRQPMYVWPFWFLVFRCCPSQTTALNRGFGNCRWAKPGAGASFRFPRYCCVFLGGFFVQGVAAFVAFVIGPGQRVCAKRLLDASLNTCVLSAGLHARRCSTPKNAP